MDLLCYVPAGWTFNLRPAEAKRDWMDRTPDAFAYRCLPLNIANAHGWEVLSPNTFEAIWNGGSGRTDVVVRMIGRHEPAYAPVSLFGNGVLTIHMHGLFRTPPGWNLWVSGPPNRPKDGVYPLTGIVETDWSPYTFTMNWQITRANQWIRFDEGEPICFFFPVQRGLLDTVAPKLVALEKNPDLLRQFNDWRESRDRFYKNLPAGGAGGDTWQKRYYRGVDMHDRCPVSDHETKLRVKPFTRGEAPQRLAGPVAASAPVDPATPPATPAPGTPADPGAIRQALQAIGVELMMGADPAPLAARIVALGAPEAEARRIIETATNDPVIVKGRAMAEALRSRDWLLSSVERQRRLAHSADRIDRRAGLGADEFLEQYFAQHRPVIMLGEISDWRALAEWTPDYLAGTVGARAVDVGIEGAETPRHAGESGVRTQEMAFDAFIDRAQRPNAGNVSFNSTATPRNDEVPARLRGDLGSIEKFIDVNRGPPALHMTVRSAGGRASLRYERANQLVAQIVGRSRFTIVPAGDTPRIEALLGAQHAAPKAATEVAWAQMLAAADIKAYDVTLGPGELLFLPFGWWYEIRSLDFGVMIAYTGFKWSDETSSQPPGR